ncbi:hypothetical protein BC834DRAFT_916772 [Gloeopeniophorella convolvens]|nr:hypothetical protein BC834DRAFT_916772 [Gloeopeniophorella convolvens]
MGSAELLPARLGLPRIVARTLLVPLRIRAPLLENAKSITHLLDCLGTSALSLSLAFIWLGSKMTLNLFRRIGTGPRAMSGNKIEWSCANANSPRDFPVFGSADFIACAAEPWKSQFAYHEYLLTYRSGAEDSPRALGPSFDLPVPIKSNARLTRPRRLRSPSRALVDCIGSRCDELPRGLDLPR